MSECYKERLEWKKDLGYMFRGRIDLGSFMVNCHLVGYLSPKTDKFLLDIVYKKSISEEFTICNTGYDTLKEVEDAVIEFFEKIENYIYSREL